MLKKILKACLLSVALFSMLIFTAPSVSLAQDAFPKMAVVDMNGILQHAKAGKTIQSQLEKKRASYQKQIKKQETALRSAEKVLLKEKGTLSASDFAKKRKIFEKKVLSAQKMVHEHKRTLEYGVSVALNVLKKSAAQVVADIAKERKLSMVFLKDSVVIAEKSLDITAESLKRLDAKITKIPVTWSLPNKK